MSITTAVTTPVAARELSQYAARLDVSSFANAASEYLDVLARTSGQTGSTPVVRRFDEVLAIPDLHSAWSQMRAQIYNAVRQIGDVPDIGTPGITIARERVARVKAVSDELADIEASYDPRDISGPAFAARTRLHDVANHARSVVMREARLFESF